MRIVAAALASVARPPHCRPRRAGGAEAVALTCARRVLYLSPLRLS
ncbi:hypothetical protein [Lancefieldella rimae]|nr:hypothetical protein [Lancefieldella rimae]